MKHIKDVVVVHAIRAKPICTGKFHHVAADDVALLVLCRKLSLSFLSCATLVSASGTGPRCPTLPALT